MSSKKDNSARDYAIGMDWWRKGYALREPQPSSTLQLGELGYLDARGSWSPLLDLTNEDRLTAAGYQPPKGLRRLADETETWGPKFLSTVEQAKIDLGANITTESLGLPLAAKVAWEYTSENGFGAVLFCPGGVTLRRYASDAPLRAWLTDNIRKLLRDHNVLKKSGLQIHIPAQVFVTDTPNINLWSKSSHSVVIGANAAVDVPGGAGAGAGGQMAYYKSSRTDGWESFNGERVVFFSGVRMRLSKRRVVGLIKLKDVPPSEYKGGPADYAGSVKFNVPLAESEDLDATVTELYEAELDQV